jgi:hypothetical protein
MDMVTPEQLFPFDKTRRTPSTSTSPRSHRLCCCSQSWEVLVEVVAEVEAGVEAYPVVVEPFHTKPH